MKLPETIISLLNTYLLADIFFIYDCSAIFLGLPRFRGADGSFIALIAACAAARAIFSRTESLFFNTDDSDFVFIAV